MDATIHKSVERSSLSFAVFIVFAVAMTLIVLNKAEKAIAEINALQDTPFYSEVRHITK